MSKVYRFEVNCRGTSRYSNILIDNEKGIVQMIENVEKALNVLRRCSLACKRVSVSKLFVMGGVSERECAVSGFDGEYYAYREKERNVVWSDKLLADYRKKETEVEKTWSPIVMVGGAAVTVFTGYGDVGFTVEADHLDLRLANYKGGGKAEKEILDGFQEAFGPAKEV